jgi:kinesin light chain
MMFFLRFSDVNRMSQDDILQSTKSVIQGLDALKNEHEKMLENIVHSSEILSSNKIEEKLCLLRKSMDMIDLGLLK